MRYIKQVKTGIKCLHGMRSTRSRVSHSIRGFSGDVYVKIPVVLTDKNIMPGMSVKLPVATTLVAVDVCKAVGVSTGMCGCCDLTMTAGDDSVSSHELPVSKFRNSISSTFPHTPSQTSPDLHTPTSS